MAATEHTVKVFSSGPPLYDCHETTWLEWELPIEIEKEATKFIEKKLKAFLKKCKCECCEHERQEKQTK